VRPEARATPVVALFDEEHGGAQREQPQFALVIGGAKRKKLSLNQLYSIIERCVCV
jgi:hypothetical protein